MFTIIIYTCRDEYIFVANDYSQDENYIYIESKDVSLTFRKKNICGWSIKKLTEE